jgi:hypothetical protein
MGGTRPVQPVGRLLECGPGHDEQAGAAEYARSLGWPVREIAADHEGLATAPDLLVSALLEAAALDPAGPGPRR